MARTITISTTGGVSTNNATPAVPTTAVGDPPQWSDGSDASYVLIQGIYQTGVGIPGTATANLVPDSTVRARADSTVVARLRMSGPASKPLPLVVIVGQDGRLLISGGNDGFSPGGVEWVDIPLSGTADNMRQFLNYIGSGGELMRLRIAAATAFTYPSGSTSYQWYVYEAQLVLTIPSVDAPPCRIFPRSDGLGIGAGRAFPPPRSQQRSPGNRGVGYY